MVIQADIFDIQRYSINDGPGIRTTVFFKGCPLRCLWCENPESQLSRPQLLFFDSLCVRCYRCLAACPEKAVSAHKDGAVNTDRDRCKACGACVRSCLNDARMISGKTMSLQQVMDVVLKDSLFYSNSGGGVTASGGEPTVQHEFLLELFKACRNRGIHTVLDTCGYVKWDILQSILRYTDLVLYDIKHMDAATHLKLTGVDNTLIVDNAVKMALAGQPMSVRVPLIPDCNDSPEHINALGDFVANTLKLPAIDILPYHALGENKYLRLGIKYPLTGTKSFEDVQLEHIREIFESYHLEVRTT